MASGQKKVWPETENFSDGKYPKKRQGAVAMVNGAVYQILLLLWYLLHLYNKSHHFEILSEMIDAEQVDDIVILYGAKGSDAVFKQVKFRKYEKPIRIKEMLDFEGYTRKQDDFVLRKYFQSYCKIIRNNTFKNIKVNYITIVTNTDFDEKLKEYFKRDNRYVLEMPNTKTLKLNIKPKNEWFLNRVRKNLQNSPSYKTLAMEMHTRHSKQTDKVNALEDRVIILKTYKKFLSKYVLERSTDNQGYLQFRKSFVDGSFDTEVEAYSEVVTKFQETIRNIFGSGWESTKFKATKNFLKDEVFELDEHEVPFEFNEDDVQRFIEILRFVKTPSKEDISLLIKDELARNLEEFKLDIVYDRFFIKILKWYENFDGHRLNLISVHQWFKEVEDLFVEFSFESFLQDLFD